MLKKLQFCFLPSPSAHCADVISYFLSLCAIYPLFFRFNRFFFYHYKSPKSTLHQLLLSPLLLLSLLLLIYFYFYFYFKAFGTIIISSNSQYMAPFIVRNITSCTVSGQRELYQRKKRSNAPGNYDLLGFEYCDWY